MQVSWGLIRAQAGRELSQELWGTGRTTQVSRGKREAKKAGSRPKALREPPELCR